ncbi:preprotein translocase subunit SecY [Marinilactibacillus psychrotolerans]|uniref:Protein translocase subunit SecY n=2 Tax=Marinilactibacillus psychrotolerans TaxID=191770 RepID=A0A5R9C4R4_9LACT|nr:preprotein translocase subunit SecY [Marinilactibacillus psychrotolerans]TLQ07906.1 preprotein translocase subunit SecY [Marinilactibacillus psychrotolerans]SJN33312.1 Preprotein translocase secY subunit (TC 3.A.5.1.1) [Marinilactibacillus psychrotolerans 42ea]
MIELIKGAIKEKDVRTRVMFTLGILIVFRLGTHITVPGVNAQALDELSTTGLFNLLDTFGGGALNKYSLFALGVSPYITASIVIQLLQMDVLPKFKEWAEQGEVGRKKLNQATRYLTIVLAFFQAIGISYGFNALSEFDLVRNPGPTTYLMIAVMLTAGTMLVMWLGEMITVHGFGNGISLIIFSGIIARLPQDITEFYNVQIRNAGDEIVTSVLFAIGIIVAMIILVIFVTYMENAKRNIPVRYSKRANASKEGAFLPLKVNSAGVIPVIFASSFLMTPQIILGYFAQNNQKAGWYQVLNNIFDLQQPTGAVFYLFLIVVFAYFYAFIQVNPEKAAENLQKQNGYIPSIRPGKATEEYLGYMLIRLSTVGAIYLGIISILPIIASALWKLPSSLALGGTSLLIVVGVALDSMRQLEGLLSKKSYQGFIQR